MGLLSRFHFGRGERLQALQKDEDFLLITWDSCRYDTFLKAKKPVLDEFGPARRGWAMGTYTLPAHVSMFQGFLPHVFSPEPFYNRFYQQLWRVGERRIRVKPLVTFPEKTENVLHGFRRRGYFTVGVGAMSWFRDTASLRDGFERFEYTGPAARKQNQIIMREVDTRAAKRNCFAFVNYGETHSPFEHEGMPGAPPKVKEQFGWKRWQQQYTPVESGWTFGEEAYQRQVQCAEYLDERTGELLQFFRKRGRPTTVVICGDHGECFGENGVWGHGVYHEKVMEVPILIFRLNAEPHESPEVVE